MKHSAPDPNPQTHLRRLYVNLMSRPTLPMNRKRSCTASATPPAATSLASEDLWMRVVGASPHGISSEEERKLSQRIQQGDETALHTLVCANLRFAAKLAYKYRGRGLPLADLRQEANYGLLRAARKFDGSLGTRFISYAVWWIRMSILQAMAEQGGSIRIPGGRAADLGHVRKATAQLVLELGRMPTLDEIAARAGIRPDIARDLYLATADPVRFDAPRGAFCDSRTLGEIIPDPGAEPLDDIAARDESDFLEARLSARLTDRQRYVVRRYFGLDGEGGTTLEAIGIALGVSKERIRQIKDDSIRKLRQDPLLASLALQRAA